MLLQGQGFLFFPKALKRTSQSSEALMLTSHDLFLFSKCGGSLLDDSVSGKALATFLLGSPSLLYLRS